MNEETKNRIREEWDKTEFASSLKEVDLKVDEFRGKPYGYHKSADIIADYFLNILDQELKAKEEMARGEVIEWANKQIEIHTQLSKEIVENPDWHLGQIEQMKYLLSSLSTYQKDNEEK
jgi:hypothetical protein